MNKKNQYDPIFKLFDDKQKTALEYFKLNHSTTLKLIDNLILKFAIFYTSLEYVEKKQPKEIIKKIHFYKGYIASITNNFVVTKKLFEEGWHFQLQIILRTQYEQLQNLLAVIFDNEYFEYHTKQITENEIIPYTPKQVHINNVIKKIIKEDPEYGNVLRDLIKNMKPLYDEFSKAAHGNFTQALLMSSYPIDNENTIFDIGSVQKPYERTENYLVSMLECSQIIWFICNKKFGKLNIFELTNLPDDFKIQLIKR